MKKIGSCLILTTILIISSITNSFAMTNNFEKNDDMNLKGIETYIKGKSNSETISLDYMRGAVGEEYLLKLASDYANSFSRNNEAYDMFKSNIESTYEEVKYNNFSKKQAKELFLSVANLETGKAKESNMTYSSKTPSHAPSHPEVPVIRDNSIELQGVNDKSTRTNYETTGIGYEVRSNPGYNKTTSYLYVGDSNIYTPQGRAGYMFHTIYHNGKYQDIGIGYFGGEWKAIVSGAWTGWGTGKVSIEPGDKLYFKLWIGSDNRIYFQILDGNNFSRIIFQNSYSTSNQIPSNGSGVTFNRQITLVDDDNNPNSGIYLKDAIFDQSYLYSPTATERFQHNNTVSSRRGKFGCNWASVNKVIINSNTRWSSENISMTMN